MERIFVSLRRSGMKSNLFGHRPAPRSVRAGLAVALLLPLLAACGSEAAGSGAGSGASSGAGSGAGGGGNGAETPAGSPPATLGYCGLSPEGSAERTADGMTFPATTDYLGKTEAEARQLAESRGLTLRVVGQDGECGIVTDDLRTERVNVYL